MNDKDIWRKGYYRVLKCDTKHICLNQVHNRLTHTQRCMGNMTSTNTVVSWRNEKEENAF